MHEVQEKFAWLCLYTCHCCFAHRWFDKSITLMVTGSGKSSVNFEHAWGDGVAVLRYFNEVFQDTTEKPHVHIGSVPAQVDSAAAVAKLGGWLIAALCLMVLKYHGCLSHEIILHLSPVLFVLRVITCFKFQPNVINQRIILNVTCIVFCRANDIDIGLA